MIHRLVFPVNEVSVGSINQFGMCNRVPTSLGQNPLQVFDHILVILDLTVESPNEFLLDPQLLLQLPFLLVEIRQQFLHIPTLALQLLDASVQTVLVGLGLS